MYTDIVPKISCQLRIGNVYQMNEKTLYYRVIVCQFLIGNVYHKMRFEIRIRWKCQFLIGNVYQLILSVSNYDTTPFSSQNQSKMFKKSVDLQQLRLCKPLILQHSILLLNYSLTSTGFLSKNNANLYKIVLFSSI